MTNLNQTCQAIMKFIGVGNPWIIIDALLSLPYGMKAVWTGSDIDKHTFIHATHTSPDSYKIELV